VFRYQREVWSRSDVTGYDELIDMSGATEIREGSTERVQALANLAAEMDPPGGASRMAIVAPHDVSYGVSRMFQAFKEMNQRGTKKVAVFRDRAEAIAWLAGERPEPGAS
jgi:hypothetical protein